MGINLAPSGLTSDYYNLTCHIVGSDANFVRINQLSIETNE